MEALDLTKSLGIHLLLIKENVYELDDLSEFIYKQNRFRQ